MRTARVLVAVMLAAGFFAVASAQSQQSQSPEGFLGQTIADVTVRSAGQIIDDPVVLSIIETRIGEPLVMSRVRDTIDHLVGLGRYDDVRLFAAAAPAGAGVSLRWELQPIQHIVAVDVQGDGLSHDSIRAFVEERFESRPAASRADEIAAAVAGFHAERGFRRARVTTALVPGETPGAVTLVLAVDPGPRTTIGRATVTGSPPGPAADILSRLDLKPGRPYDRSELEARVDAYEERLRRDGYYESTVNLTTTFDDRAETVDVAVDVEPGPRVRLVFAGDPVQSSALESLVPVRAERSVDEDLLEDASRNIQAYLRERGYRSAEAPYERREADGVLELIFTVTTGPLHRVGRVDVTGNTGIPLSDLEPLLKMTPGEPFVDARVAAIGAAIEEMYRVRGYQRVQVRPVVEVLPEVVDGSVRYRPVDTRLEIVEGPQTTVAQVIVTGADQLGEDRVRQPLLLVPGRPFYAEQLRADRSELERLYRNEGFLAASVTPSLAFADEDSLVTVTWNVREGAQTLVDHILITGNARTNPDIIRRELRIQPGDPLGADAIAESQRRLSDLGLFRRVRITDIARSTSPNRDLLVEVEEAPATSITYGGGLEAGRRARASSTDGQVEDRIEVAPRAFFQIDRRNLWGKNRSVSFFSRVVVRRRDPPTDSTDPSDTGGYGLNEYLVTGTFREPRVFGTGGDAQVTAFLERGIRASFSFDRRGVRTDYARRLGPGLTVTGRYTNDYTELFDEKIVPEDRLLIDRLFPQVRLSTFFGAILRDSRDDVLDPQRGTVLGVDGSVAARAYGSEVGFSKTFLQGFVYRRLPGRGFVVAAGARLGLARGFPREVPRVDEEGNPVIGEDGTQIVDLVEEVPASERFYAGGDTTVRGFALDRLGTDETLDAQGFPQGGNGLVVLNVEMRSPYWKGLGLVGFVDTGNVFERATDIDLGEVRVATGFGIRYRSPIGPLRVDLGFKMDPRLLADGSRERRSVFHISLGQAF
jgi:outer membrane protein insertion porin family